ncbi:MAG: ATP-binding cassette domain-containing protein [Elusimicrobia bacterium]|nr:ATP-binding cassette domain-containing protein [Elusimicrobiota bacterium]
MISIKNLHKYIGGRWVLKGLDLDIEDGEIFTILGGSGEGKSVFLKHILGLLKPDKGSIRIFGKEIVGIPSRELHKVQAQIGMMFQGGALFDSMTVGENIAFGMKRLTNYDKITIEKKVEDYLAMVGLAGTSGLLPEKLSIGMRRRVALARTIATQPKCILYDEPTTGLDPITRDVICNLFLDLQRELKATSIIVTHDLKTAYKISSRIGLLHKGKIRGISKTEDFINSTDPFVQQFINGSSEGPIRVKDGGEEKK